MMVDAVQATQASLMEALRGGENALDLIVALIGKRTGLEPDKVRALLSTIQDGIEARAGQVELPLHQHLRLEAVPGKGLGVFCGVDIPSGTPITIYRCSGYREDATGAVRECAGSRHDEGDWRRLYRTHGIQVDHPTLSHIIGSPDQVDDTRRLGHMVNDCITVTECGALACWSTVAPPITVTMTRNMAVHYWTEACPKGNALYHRHEGGVVVVVASALIPANTEITVPYGPDYWGAVLFPEEGFCDKFMAGMSVPLARHLRSLGADKYGRPASRASALRMLKQLPPGPFREALQSLVDGDWLG